MGAEAFSPAGQLAQAVSPRSAGRRPAPAESHQLKHALGHFGDTAEDGNWWEKFDFDQDEEENKEKEQRRAEETEEKDL